MTLPPGQQAVDAFPRFGTHLHERPPAVPADPVIEVAGAVTEPFTISQADLADVPRRELTADFHCVAGWSVTGLRWEGVPFEAFYRTVVEPQVQPGAAATHLLLGCLDGYRIGVSLEDALGDDVLLADRLDGQPLDGRHGAPFRFVSPGQYGFVNAKHLCRIEVHTSEPTDDYGGNLLTRTLMRLFSRHPRARVWHEERHRFLPPVFVRLLGKAIIGPVKGLSARGGRPAR